MRKFLALFLTALMLVSVLAALPVSAGIPVGGGPAKLKGDPSVDSPKLIVTEVMYDSGAPKEGSDTYDAQNVYDYVEIYNAGTTNIDLYSLAILATDDSGTVSNSKWCSDDYTFISGCKAVVTSSFNTQGSVPYSVTNPSAANALLKPGKFAVLWIWTNTTVTRCDTEGRNLADSNFKAFRDFYTQQQAEMGGNAVPNDLLVVAVNGTNISAGGTNYPKDKNGQPQKFDFSTSARMYGLVKNSVGLDTPVYTNSGLNDDVYCLFHVGAGVKNSVTTGAESYTGYSNLYVPAKSSPDLYNELGKQAAQVEGKTYTNESDYVTAEIAISYRQSALMLYAETPTLGTMEAYQWMYVDPDRAPASIATAGWKDAAWNTLKEARVMDLESSDHTETQKEVANVTQEDILNKTGSNTRTYTVTKLTTWGLILIIVGGVVGVVGIVVLIILLAKKKKKTPAEEPAPEDEPIDDAPVDDTPADGANE